MRIARLAIGAVVLLTACDGSTPQAPPLDPPSTSSPSESGGACGQTVVDEPPPSGSSPTATAWTAT